MLIEQNAEISDSTTPVKEPEDPAGNQDVPTEEPVDPVDKPDVNPTDDGQETLPDDD
jgi:hypothetical protein